MIGVNQVQNILSRSAERSVKSAAAVMLALTFSACSTLESVTLLGQSKSSDTTLISRNLVDAVLQNPDLAPARTTLQVASRDGSFEREVHKELISRGYQLEDAVSSSDATSVVATVRAVDESVGQHSPVYILSIGGVTAERQFEQIDGKSVPAGPLIMRGADESLIALNDAELFDTSEDAAFSTVSFKSINLREYHSNDKPDAIVTENENIDVLELLSTEVRAESTGLWNEAEQAAVKANIFETGQSNFSELFTEYENVNQSILVFPNDSLMLGETNKLIIEQYVEQMDADTDIVSVIGCSHGQTRINNGNSLLALGRANRVKEALLFLGVEHDQVLDEGCWAAEHFDKVMPRRGVVVTLKRKKNA